MEEGRDNLLPPSNLPDSVAQDDDLDVPEIQASSNIASPAENLPADIISGEPNVLESQESTTVSSPPISLPLTAFGRADITSATSDRRCSSDSSPSAFSRSTDNPSIEATSRSQSTISQGESSGSHREGIRLVRPPFVAKKFGCGQASQGESSGSHREGIRLVRPPFLSGREKFRIGVVTIQRSGLSGESSGSHLEGIRLVRPPFLSGQASQGESSGSHREGIRLVRPPFLSGQASQGESSGSHREGIRLVRPPFLSGQASQGESSGSHREGIRLVRPPFLSGQASQGESSGSHREGIRLVRPPFLSGQASQGESSGSHREGIRLVRPPFLSGQASQGESSGSHREGIRLVRPPFLSGRASSQPIPRFPRGNRPVALQMVRWSFIRINGLIHNANATAVRSMGPSHQGVDIESPSSSNESTSDTQPSIEQGESSGIHTEGQIQPLGEEPTSELSAADRTTEAVNPQATAAHVGHEVISDSNPASEREPREPSLQLPKESKLTESVEDDSKMSFANLVLEQNLQDIPSSSGTAQQKDSGDTAKMDEPMSPANLMPEESSRDIPSSSGTAQQKDSDEPTKTESRKEQMSRIKKAEEDEGLEECPPKKGRGGSKSSGTRRRHSRRSPPFSCIARKSLSEKFALCGSKEKYINNCFLSH
ncbi:hypothetical protein CDAR_180371 [Caerostris darwini]|uniref:Uncharacterized protein n=1 Tax=Caerostris darwini TaxID=1538125 RepID=A0AAV4NRX5_9ARAC|nr:hypothetical protein CDAR_180371 [Caerostris darwini]